ncbi:TIGR02221 family CRISPR-associated protein [Rubrobacter calidifluminis]|uniref:TIGR02221 family CRISPR-associated protein n=1 Tax=Rubrobacter calidifluminis TaxID=1392640 RepID=UPI002362F253|nr:TIGR02221 family CRISPR-associated protein [Rubrobacter calidifluminis]
MKKLVCVVGTGEYKQVNYLFGTWRRHTNLAPVAIGCCVIGAGEDLELVALLTRRARDRYEEELCSEAERQGWAYTPVDIPDGKSEAELWEIFEKFGEHLKEGDEVILDLTHGFRHLPALLLSAVQYHAARKRIKTLGVYYGAYEARDESNNVPIFDLTPLVDLPEWSYGVRLFSDYLLPGPLGEMLERIQRRSHQRSGEQPFTRLQQVGRALFDLEAPLASGMPLEAGFEAHRALEKARSAEEELSRLAPLRGFWEELKGQLTSFALPEPEAPKGNKPKKGMILTIEELERQAHLVDGYLAISDLRAAATLMRELIVSAVILHTQDPKRWLEGEERQRAERRLGVIASWNRGAFQLKKLLSKEQQELATLWDQVRERRNALAHAGMREDMVKFDDKALREIHAKIKENLCNPGFWSTEVERKDERWLVSPLGMTPGALYTAIVQESPDHLFIITSQKAKQKVGEILTEAGREDLEVSCLILDDPFNGFDEAREKAEEALKEHGPRWAAAQEVIVNRTGGTTCLGWAVERIEAALRRDLGLESRTVACIDRRDPEEQRKRPYVRGEVIDITERGEEE